MNETKVRAFFDRYLAAFVQCVRSGSDDMQPVVDHFRLPLLLSSDHGAMSASATADGTEIGRLRATYLVTGDAQGPGFAGLILQG